MGSYSRQTPGDRVTWQHACAITKRKLRSVGQKSGLRLGLYRRALAAGFDQVTLRVRPVGDNLSKRVVNVVRRSTIVARHARRQGSVGDQSLVQRPPSGLGVIV